MNKSAKTTKIYAVNMKHRTHRPFRRTRSRGLGFYTIVFATVATLTYLYKKPGNCKPMQADVSAGLVLFLKLHLGGGIYSCNRQIFVTAKI